ncbi:hypothetical protein N8T08_008594 [Aspergillus melleus]|uniref:Uncharacterized protein n=1 Tax=Aspergillus melleus TaxID=138277 RepID=A0ACC3BE66_9EURO|nr:hypothetical protein N8T08_008594 [Aspergillus melleus]
MLIFYSSLTVSVLALVPQLASSANISSTVEWSHGLPLLKLPYGTWRAHKYNVEADVYVFRNVRYAAPPLGELRWSKPAPPKFVSGVQDGSYGHNCIPAQIPDQFFMPGVENLTKNSAEDCLFLDVYIPGKVFTQRQELVPVVVWIHGGAYVSGSKDQAIGEGYYDGTGLIQQADDNLIVVTINYRLGAFGFLAGEPLLSQGVFNAGLHDQRAALAWVQAYIQLLGGDPDNVSAWGQSGGGGSLMYHLIAEGGNIDPLFRRAILQSPSFGVNANHEVIYKRFRDFAAAAKCPTEGEDSLRCLRLANTTILTSANEDVYLGESSPVPDGEYIRYPALFEYAKGNTWKNIESVIVSHVIDEASLGLPDPIPKDQVEAFVSNNLPANATEQTKRIASLYESLYANSTEKEMLWALYNDLLYTCNIRAVLKTFPSSAWAFQFSFLDGVVNGKHGSDMPATWYNKNLQNRAEPLFGDFQRYVTNHARTGNPNTPRSKNHELAYWPEVRGLEEDVVGNVLNMSNWRFGVIHDGQMRRSFCDAWTVALVEAVESDY